VLTSAAAILAGGLLALGTTASPAAPDAPVDVVRDGSGNGSVILRPRDPGSGGGSTPGGAASGNPTGHGAAGTSTCTYAGRRIDCTSTAGVWSAEKACWVQKVVPQPPANDPIWEGNTDGAIYRCTTPQIPGTLIGSSTEYWAADSGAGAPTLIDPVTLATEAVERMRLKGPVVAVTPVDAAAPLLVGVDAWLWLDDDGPRSVGPISRTATAGSVSVTATAVVTKVVWDMGDGTTVTCTGPGTPWTPARGTGPSPTCGHRYLQPSTAEPGGTFSVRATTHWQVDWTGAGQSGVITFTLTGERALEVTELQVLQTS
jgi:hypothetical protein